MPGGYAGKTNFATIEFGIFFAIFPAFYSILRRRGALGREEIVHWIRAHRLKNSKREKIGK